ncbi:capsule biosynthesis GfcC family protein [Vibrio profundum]|uniref:capsule biosynthesis GfcC family protein n=1 Tax=Vibrio profundum TaxID=2910247 RepID=UPI003D0D814F
MIRLTKPYLLVFILAWPFAAFSAQTSTSEPASTATQAPTTTVDVLMDGHNALQLTYYPSPPRLSQVVTDALKTEHKNITDVDWLSSALYDLDTPERDWSPVFDAATQQLHLSSEATRGQWEAFLRQVKSMHFSVRFSGSVDPDYTRLAIKNNPSLTGHYLLSLNSEKNIHGVTVMGNVHTAKSYPWQPQQSIQAYLALAQPLDNTLGEIWVIQPDGKVYQPKIGYWNSQAFNLAPGAILYVPLDVDTDKPLPTSPGKNLNQLIVELLSNNVFS